MVDLFNRALPLHQSGRLAEAAALYGQVLAIDPGNFDALHLLGVIDVDSGHAEQGAALIAQALARDPGVAAAHSNLARALIDLERHDEAVARCDAAIALEPGFPDAHGNRGLALLRLRRPADALASLDRAIALRPDAAQWRYNRGLALSDLGRADEALAAYDQAIGLDPQLAVAHYSRALLLDQMMRSEEALAAYDRVIALRPEFKRAMRNRSLVLLRLGRYEAGWRDFEWRKSEWSPTFQQFAGARAWTGEEEVRGRTVFVYSEEGLGDILQFCRYIRLLDQRGARTILMAPPPLTGLLQQLTPGRPIVVAGSAVPAFDYQCALMSLPLAFRTTLETIPADVPYLHAEPEAVSRWARRLDERGGRPRVGLVWAGGAVPGNAEQNALDRRRSVTLAQYGPLARAEGVRFVSLQKGEAAGQARRPPEGLDLVDLTDEIVDFADTAALVANLDLVITVDTAVAHLAGALGKPVWILSRFDGCWRWLNGREDSPWYPSARVFHQRSPGAWDEVMQRVAAELGRFAKGSFPT